MRDFREDGKRRGESDDRVGAPRVGKAVAARTGDRDFEAPRAKRLHHCRIRSCSVEHDVRGDAPRESALVVNVPHPAQVAFAFFAYIAHQDQRRGKLHFGLDQSVGQGEHPGETGAVIGGAGSGETVAVDHRIESGSRRKHRIQMRG
jgi:hypothetical protein